MFASATFLLVWAQLPVRTPLPVLLELRRDVEVRSSEVLPDGTTRQLRGVLYADTAMRLHPGEWITMTSIGVEGSCRVRVRKTELALRSCPWLEGFADHQSDIFHVFRSRKQKPAPAPSTYGQR